MMTEIEAAIKDNPNEDQIMKDLIGFLREEEEL